MTTVCFQTSAENPDLHFFLDGLKYSADDFKFTQPIRADFLYHVPTAFFSAVKKNLQAKKDIEFFVAYKKEGGIIVPMNGVGAIWNKKIPPRYFATPFFGSKSEPIDIRKEYKKFVASVSDNYPFDFTVTIAFPEELNKISSKGEIIGWVEVDESSGSVFLNYEIGVYLESTSAFSVTGTTHNFTTNPFTKDLLCKADSPKPKKKRKISMRINHKY